VSRGLSLWASREMLLKGPEEMAEKHVVSGYRRKVSYRHRAWASCLGIASGGPQMGVVVLVANGYRNRASRMLLY
jgi:hypothetical protein